MKAKSPSTTKCPDCLGAGTDPSCKPNDEFEYCTTCEGTGYVAAPARKPMALAGTASMSGLSRYAVTASQDCQDCGGSGKDPGELNSWDAGPCPACHGSGMESVERNYLAEAFRIAAGEAQMAPETAHLKAVVEYCREMTSAALSLPEVA
jgi:DnaJ-class molecular chaperone